MLAAPYGSTSEQTTNTAALSIWRSRESSLQQRLAAALQLVPLGTQQFDAERLLGKPTRYARYHGPLFHLESITNANGTVTNSVGVTSLDDWCDYYDFPGGQFVRVTFDINASSSNWMLRPVTGISCGNTNDDRRFSGSIQWIPDTTNHNATKPK